MQIKKTNLQSLLDLVLIIFALKALNVLKILVLNLWKYPKLTIFFRLDLV
ncbi:unnamed protein product [Meloidogyne enterolobii]|uniref:Uncharacterized protein n=1 Tax=Meloidogyne enterolobii TaxID=390850 RepID=A0ACB0ZYX2_MELEN